MTGLTEIRGRALVRLADERALQQGEVVRYTGREAARERKRVRKRERKQKRSSDE